MELVVVGVYKRWTHVQLAFPSKKSHMSKNLPQIKHVTKERGHEFGKTGDSECKRRRL